MKTKTLHFMFSVDVANDELNSVESLTRIVLCDATSRIKEHPSIDDVRFMKAFDKCDKCLSK